MNQIRTIDIKKDLAAVREHFQMLDMENRYLRFHNLITDEVLEQYLQKIQDSDICVGLFLDRPQSITNTTNTTNTTLPVCAGFLHISLASPEAEIGISVLKKYQGYNFASALMALGVSEFDARNLPANVELTMQCEVDNKASIALGKKFGVKVIVYRAHDQYEIATTRQKKFNKI